MPVILFGLSTKLINKKMRRNLEPENNQKQLDIIIASLFAKITPTDFGSFDYDEQTHTTREETGTPSKDGYIL